MSYQAGWTGVVWLGRHIAWTGGGLREGGYTTEQIPNNYQEQSHGLPHGKMNNTLASAQKYSRGKGADIPNPTPIDITPGFEIN
jgi:hypothetical protein